MGKISAEAKRKYAEKIKEYKQTVEGLIKHEKNVAQTVNPDDPGAPYKNLTLADECLDIISYYILMNELSVNLLAVKNEAFLNDARKTSYRSLIYLENVVTNYIDEPFSSYSEKLEQITSFGPEKRWQLIRKLGFCIDSVREGFGENTKWKWAFVEIEGRFASVVKNLLNLKTYLVDTGPESDIAPLLLRHAKLAKRLLQNAADSYRQKYELSTSRIDDFKLAIHYLGALRRLHLIFGEDQEAEVIKKKRDIWAQKMEQDYRAKDKKK